MKPSQDSLDDWRDYFRRGDSDIFGIINHAIILAAADFPNEFKSRRDGIAQLLFSRNASRSCIGCGREDNHETVGGSGGRDDSGGAGGGEEDEKKVNDNEIVVDEVVRIRDILLNKEDESNSVLFHSLRKLESMSLSVDLLKGTEIGKAVNGLRKHGSDKIRELAKALFAEWKELVDQWMNSTNEIAGSQYLANAGDEGTPESANYSVVDEAEAFPSPPHDLDFLAPEPTGFELSQVLCKHIFPLSYFVLVIILFATLFSTLKLFLIPLVMFSDPRHSVEPKRKSMRRPEGTREPNLVGRYNKNQQTRREEVDARPMKHSATVFDEPRRQPKQTREQMVHPIQRKPIVIPEQKRNSQQDKLKAMDPDAKFEFAKRKLQESYQQHDKAKRQRTIQVLETIPKQGKVQKPQFKRPMR
ncbi:hypothetical protein F2Q69_00032000, partial [Brassica cretica]